MRVALLEDDSVQAALIKGWLESDGHACVHFATGRDFRAGIRASHAELIIVDRGLPDEDGIEITRWLRTEFNARVPVLFASAFGAEADIVGALEAGADDYVVKPPRRDELLARIRALGRRTGTAAGVLTCGSLVLDTRRRVASVDGIPVELTDREFDLAAYLVANQGRLVPRAELLERVWRTTAALDTRTVDTHASRVRRKLNLQGGGAAELETVYGFGYRLR